MGADTKALRSRIKSVNNTMHLTKAMGLVASSKIRKSSIAMDKSLQFAGGVENLVNVLTSCPECQKSGYMQVRDTGRDRIIVIAGDRGMAGGYNSNVFRLAYAYEGAEMIPIGLRACDRYGAERISSEHITRQDVMAMAFSLCRDFIDEKYDRLGIISTEYISVLKQEPVINWVLPLNNSEAESRQIIFEPDELTILGAAVPEYVCGKIYAAIKESFACEVTARRNAMDSASRNAQEMIDNLTLEYNRARQGSITQEITEIVSTTNAV